MIEEQVHRWQISKTEKKKEEVIPVITISREPGSGGRLVAKGIADRLGFDLFHQEVIHEMAESAKVSERLLETLDEKGLSVIDDWVSSMVDDRHLWPDQYMQHLLKVIGTIGKHGRAVMVGRGANFVLPPEKRFRVRIVAPRKFRAKHVSDDFGISLGDAERRVMQTEANRRAFIRKYFHADIADPTNYDLVINTGTVNIETAVEIIARAMGK